MQWLRRTSLRIQHKQEDVFEALGRKIAGRPRKTMLLSLAFVAICSLGWINFADEDDPQKFLTPQDSRAIRDREFVEDRFEDAPSVSNCFLNRRGNGRNVLEKEALLELMDFHERMIRVDAFSDTEGYDERTCAPVFWRKNTDDLPSSCRRESVLAYWRYNRTLLELDDDVLGTINAGGEDCCGQNGPLRIESVAAKIGRDRETGLVVSAGALRQGYYLNQDRHDKTRQDPVVYRLELNFDATARRQNLQYFERPMPLTPSGANENVDAAFAYDRTVVTVAFVTINLYAYFALYSRNPRRNRAKLGLYAVCCVALAVAAAWGLCFGFGAELSPLGTVAAFLVLGIGVDDAFVILGGLDDASAEADAADVVSGARDLDAVVADRVAFALRLAGPSILTTSLTDASAFFAGSWTRIPAISNFCTFAAVSVLCDFILQTTLFVAIFFYDERRKVLGDVNRLSKALDDEKDVKKALDDDEKADASAARDEESPKDVTTVVVVEDDHNKRKNPALPRNSWFGRVYAKYLLSWPVMCLVVCATVSTVCVGFVGALRFELGFEYHWFYAYGVGFNYVPRNDAFRRKWFEEVGAGEDSAPSYGLYTKEADYFEEGDSMRRLLDKFASLDFVSADSVDANWYDAHRRWALDADKVPTNSEEYLASVKEFVDTDGASYAPKIIFDDTTGAITATQIDTQWRQPSDTPESIEWMRESRKKAKDAAPQLQPRVYAEVFVWIEGLAIITHETFRSLLVACAVVVVVLCLLIGDLAIASLVGAQVCSICICTFGSIYWYGDQLNFISGFFIVIATGLSVDAPAHLSHTYVHAPASLKTGRDRVIYALDTLGSSIFRGSFSTLAGVLVIGLAKTYVFATFFWYLTTIMVLSLWFGLVFGPVALALLGPYLYSTQGSDLIETDKFLPTQASPNTPVTAQENTAVLPPGGTDDGRNNIEYDQKTPEP